MALKHQALPDQATQENFLDVDNRLGFFEGKIYRGFGTPEATVKANPGAIYLNDSGGPSTSLYMKESGTGNTGWSAVGAASAAGLHNLLSATHPDTLADSVVAGDLIIGNATPKWARLAAGSNGQVLTLSGGLPTWAAASGGATALLDGSTHTDTTNSAVTRGDLIVGNSTPAWDDLAIGAASTVLTSDGTDPSWGTVTSAMITNGTIVDADVNATGITTRTKLPSAIAYEDEANTFTTGQNKFTGDGGTSDSTGGSINVTTTGHTGSGITIYSNRGADAGARALMVWQDNAANPRQALRVLNDGTGQTVSLQSTNASADETLSINSATTSGFSTFGVTGQVTDKGTAKITHDHPGSAGDDANAAILRLNWSDTGLSGSAVQGIFMATEGGATGAATTGDLIKIWNGGSTGGTATTKLWLDPNGQLALNQTGTTGGLLLGADVLLYRSAADKLSLGAGDSFDSPTIITPTIASFANATHNHSNAAGGGNLTGTAFTTQSANRVFAGPTTGAAATATFRALVNADITELLAIADLTDVTASSGTGTTVLFQGSPSITTPTIASFVNATHTHANAAGGGNITGTAFATQSANTVFAGPTTGAAATATFRALVTADVAELLAATDLSDVAAKSGTGTTILFQGSPTITTPTIASFTNSTHTHQDAAGGGTLDHGLALTGLSDDDHAQYALLAGRAGGQTLKGGTAASESLTLMSTSHATLGTVTTADQVTLTQTGSTGGLVIGGDTNLFRRTTDVLSTDDSFSTGAIVQGNAAGSAVGVLLRSNGRIETVSTGGFAWQVFDGANDSEPRFTLTRTGTMSWAAATGATDNDLSRGGVTGMNFSSGLGVATRLVAGGTAASGATAVTSTAGGGYQVIVEPLDLTFTTAANSFAALAVSGTLKQNVAPSASWLLCFNFQPTITTNGSYALGAAGIFLAKPTFSPLNTSTTTGASFSAMTSDPTWTAMTSGTNTVTSNYAVTSLGTLNTGVTVTDWAGVRVLDPLGSGGTITNFVGVDIDSITSRSSTILASLRSAGTTVEMRHAGPALFGSTSGVSGTSASDPTVELERVSTITGAVANGFSGSLALDPGYTAATAQTVAIHNYIDMQDVSNAGAGPSAVTNSAVARFDAAVATHKALAVNATVATTLGSTGPTGSTAGAPQGWMKINVNGTLRYIPFW